MTRDLVVDMPSSGGSRAGSGGLATPPPRVHHSTFRLSPLLKTEGRPDPQPDQQRSLQQQQQQQQQDEQHEGGSPATPGRREDSPLSSPPTAHKQGRLAVTPSPARGEHAATPAKARFTHTNALFNDYSEEQQASPAGPPLRSALAAHSTPVLSAFASRHQQHRGSPAEDIEGLSPREVGPADRQFAHSQHRVLGVRTRCSSLCSARALAASARAQRPSSQGAGAAQQGADAGGRRQLTRMTQRASCTRRATSLTLTSCHRRAAATAPAGRAQHDQAAQGPGPARRAGRGGVLPPAG